MHIRRLLDFYRLIMSLQVIDDIHEMFKRYRETIKKFGINPKASGERTLVSIVIPTRNEADKITHLLRSIRLSSHKSVEILIADYMSSDGTLDIARSFGAKIIEVDKPGVGYASFLAVNNAKGDIVIRTDADAIFPPDLIDYTVRIFEKNGQIHLLHLGHIYVDSGFIDNLIAFLYDKYWREIWKTTGHFIAFRRELRDVVNFNPNLSVEEDFDFGRRVYEKLGARVIYYNYEIAVPVSARRIKISGRTRYLFGRAIR